MALLLVKNSACNANGFRAAVSGQMTLSGRCEPGKRNTSADHCNPLYGSESLAAQVRTGAMSHAVSLQLQKTHVFNQEGFAREAAHQGKAAPSAWLAELWGRVQKSGI